MIPAPFFCAEQQPLSVTATSASVTFTSKDQGQWPHVRVVNYGSEGCQVNLNGATAVDTAAAGGTNQYYVGAGEDVIFTRSACGKGNQSAVMSAICDSSNSTTISFHIGIGS